MTVREAPRIRVAGTGEDWGAIREICCRTGAGGEPIAPDRWPFFGELWIGPYQRLAPEWTYVAEVGDRVAGYLTGCPDTVAFERARPLAFALPLLVRVAGRRYPWNADTRRFVRRALGLMPGVEQRFPAAVRRRLLVESPAHLHMNVDAPFRHRGLGAALVSRYTDDLRRRGIAGVHLFCGADPLPFYARLGFAEVASIALPSGTAVYALARELGSA